MVSDHSLCTHARDGVILSAAKDLCLNVSDHGLGNHAPERKIDLNTTFLYNTYQE
jgi:hypothetical protein